MSAGAARHPLRTSAETAKLLREGRVAFEGVDILGLERAGLLTAMGTRVLFSAELWEPMQAAFGPCDAMVPGKYIMARQFSFHTRSFLVWCESEADGKGTAWFVADKAAASKPNTSAQIFCRTGDVEPGSAAAAELSDFFERLFLDMAIAHPPMAARLSDVPIVRAYAEASALRGHAPAPRRAPGARAASL